MKYAFFQGCNIPVRIQQYAASTAAVLKIFGIDLEVIPEFNCCGYPARNVDEKAYVLPSVRNLAIAERKGLDILVICNCCFASLQKAKNMVENDPALREELNAMLAKEGLQYTGNVTVKHYLTVCYEEIGTDSIKARLVARFKDLHIAVIHGCHILRPREITRFDDSFVPNITEALMETTGASSLEWPGKLECCGAALAGLNDDLSKKLLTEKISGARQAGADYVTPVCSYCHMQFDTTQLNILAEEPAAPSPPLPVILFPQLLGLCLGIDEKILGLDQNKTLAAEEISRIKGLLGPPVEEKKRRKKKIPATE